MFFLYFVLLVLTALFFHDLFVSGLSGLKSAVLLAGVYGAALFWALLLLKYVQGWGGEPVQLVFQSVGNLFKYGTVGLLLSVLMPLAASFILGLAGKKDGRKREGRR